MSLSLDQLRRCTVAIDLGAARTCVYLKHTGVVVNEPSVAAVNTNTGSLIAVGALAERMAGRTPGHIRVVRPVSGGTVVDIDMAQRMLRFLVGDRLRKAWRRKPMLRAAVCVPHEAEPLARRAAVETVLGLGARKVELVDTLIAAAVGCGLPVEQAEATMIVLFGTATTQVAVLSLGSIVAAEKVPVGGDAIDHAMAQHLRSAYGLVLPAQGVRPLHLALGRRAAGGDDDGGAHDTDDADDSAVITGRDAVTGLARSVRIDSRDVQEAVHTPLTAVLDAIGGVLRCCPPDLVADLGDRGVTLAGGSARLPGLDGMLRAATGMPVHVADNADVCAVQGLGAMLEGRVSPLSLDPLVG